MTHLKKELQRLEDLQSKINIKQKKLKTEKTKIGKERKALDAEKKKINSGWRELERAKKQFADQQELTSKKGLSSSAKQGRKRQSTNTKLQDQFIEMKRKYEAESKKSRDYRKKLDQLEVENKVLRNKIKNLSGRKRGRGDDKRLRQLIRENRELRKRLRKLMKELHKRRRWYKRHIRIFKKNQDKWIKAQRNAWKDKKFIIKYVFLDDVKYIKQYQKPRKGRDKIQFKNRIRVKTKGGGETTLKDVEIIVLDADNEDNESDDGDDGDDDASNQKKKKKKKKKKNGDNDDNDEDQNIEEETGDGKKKKKKKKKKKSAQDEEDELDAFLEEMSKEFAIALDDIAEDEEDLKSEDDEKDIDDEDEDFEVDDEDEEDNDDAYGDEENNDDSSLEAQIVYLRQEMSERANDLDKLKAILESSDEHQNPNQEIETLIEETITDRQNEMIKNLENLGGDSKDNDVIKESNDEWKKYVLNLSQSIIGNTEQFNCLVNMIESGFLKELNGRIKDLNHVNNAYYDEDVPQQEADLGTLKENVDQRHDEISKDINASKSEDNDDADENNNNNDERIKELSQGLLTTNQNWNELIFVSSGMHKESQSAKNNLIEQLLTKYTKLQELISKVDKLPSTVLF